MKRRSCNNATRHNNQWALIHACFCARYSATSRAKETLKFLEQPDFEELMRLLEANDWSMAQNRNDWSMAMAQLRPGSARCPVSTFHLLLQKLFFIGDPEQSCKSFSNHAAIDFQPSALLHAVLRLSSYHHLVTSLQYMFIIFLTQFAYLLRQASGKH